MESHLLEMIIQSLDFVEENATAILKQNTILEKSNGLKHIEELMGNN